MKERECSCLDIGWKSGPVAPERPPRPSWLPPCPAGLSGGVLLAHPRISRRPSCPVWIRSTCSSSSSNVSNMVPQVTTTTPAPVKVSVTRLISPSCPGPPRCWLTRSATSHIFSMDSIHNLSYIARGNMLLSGLHCTKCSPCLLDKASSILMGLG